MAVTPESDRDRIILDDLKTSGFPVDPKPYCTIAWRVSLLEGEALESIMGMRMTGVIERLGATFSGEGCALLTDDELALVDLLGGDLPYSEDPFAELAAELMRRGVEADEAWVVGRAKAWADSGVIESFGAVPSEE